MKGRREPPARPAVASGGEEVFMTRQRKMVRAGGRGVRGSAGFTLIEVLVVVAIIALLISVLLPSLARAKEMSRRTVCATRLHNIAVGVTSYAAANKGAIIECHSRTTQVAISPRLAALKNPSPNASPNQLVDWQAAAKRYCIDKVTWECPNREGLFGYEGTPDVNVQGYTAQMLRDRGYRVDTNWTYNQWILGYQYFGGIQKWEVGGSGVYYRSKSPVSANSPGHYALAADSNIKVDGFWGGGRLSAYGNIPPHSAKSGKPDGGNVLTFDGACTWIPFGKMRLLHSWSPGSRDCYWWQQDMRLDPVQ